MDLRVFRARPMVLLVALVFLLAGFPAPPGLTGPVVHGASVSTDWPMYNQTYEGVRYSSLHQINADNVRQMRQICALRLREVGPFQAGPVVIGTTMYVTTAHDTYAMNAGTCGVIWHDVYAPTGYEPFLTNHGVAVADSRVFRGTTDGHLLALDSRTGKVIWNVQPAASQKGEWLSAAPIVWQGRIFIGTAGSDWGIRGRMMAFDAATGRQIWSFSEIPVGEAPGADTWGRASSTVTGGGGTWSTFTLDPATGELFVPVANPAPDLPGDYRPGANLFTDSIVVLDARSGRLRWWYQATPHDTHDWDVAAAPVLYADANGRRLVAFADKAGYLYALDRASHTLVFKVETTTHKNDQQAPTQAGVHTCPGGLGGTEWNGPALDSPNDVLIVGAVDWCSTYTVGKAQYVAGQFFIGGTIAVDPIGIAGGWLTAVDGSTGRIRWRYHANAPIVAGVTVTAGGIVMSGDMKGAFLVLDSRTGQMLRRRATGGALAGGVIAYAINGKEYVAYTSGNASRTTFGVVGQPTVIIEALP